MLTVMIDALAQRVGVLAAPRESPEQSAQRATGRKNSRHYVYRLWTRVPQRDSFLAQAYKAINYLER